MAAETSPTGKLPEGRGGFALFAAVIVIAVLAVMATVVTVTLSGDNDQARIENAADALHRLQTAMDTVNTSAGASFTGSVTKYPGQLSQLTHKIANTELDCAGVVFGATNGPKWRGPYYLVPIPTTGYRIATGFFANNQLVKLSTTDMAIQMNGVSLADAKALELLVENISTGAGPIVTFALTDPTNVQYHNKSATLKC